MQVPFVDLTLAAREFEEEFISQVRSLCRSGRYTLGPLVEHFEQDFAAYCGVRHAVALNSGTSALHLALRCLNIGPGDEVITSPMTFVATAWAISYVGAKPVFVDIDPVRRTLDPRLLRAAITPQTRAIIPIHLYGRAADMGPILEIAEANGLPVIEDAAQAHGARVQGRRVGGLGRIGCFSFYPSKNLGACGEGGALVTDDAQVADHARQLRNHAQSQRYRHEEIGYNFRMDAIQAAALCIKLRHLDDGNTRRVRHATRYVDRLRNVRGLVLPELPAPEECVFHLFVVELQGRDEMAQRLKSDGIETGLHYPIPLHLQPAYRHLGWGAGSFPHSENLAARCLSLPLFPEMTDGQIDYVCERLARWADSGH